MISHIHHINFLVSDLNAAVARYRTMLGALKEIREDLPQRGVFSARFKVGETWIVLLQPHDMDNVPGRFMQEHGEGFFMISYRTDDLAAESTRLHAAGVAVVDERPREGLADWRVKDLSLVEWFGVNVQLAESGERSDR